MEKVIRDGKVAVLYSPGFGAGWSTWNYDHPECLFDPDIVNLIESNEDPHKISSFAEEKYGENFYAGGADYLTIAWLPIGTEFQVHEYDGSESLSIKEELTWYVA